MDDGKNEMQISDSASSSERIDMVIHDLRNFTAAVILNLELAADPAYTSGVGLEAALDALAEARRLNEAISRIRGAIGLNRKSGGASTISILPVVSGKQPLK